MKARRRQLELLKTGVLAPIPSSLGQGQWNTKDTAPFFSKCEGPFYCGGGVGMYAHFSLNHTPREAPTYIAALSLFIQKLSLCIFHFYFLKMFCSLLA